MSTKLEVKDRPRCKKTAIKNCVRLGASSKLLMMPTKARRQWLDGLASRLISKAERKDGCWRWTAAKMSNGYAVLGIGRKVFLAHRISFSLYKGALRAGQQIDHLCRTRDCINPDHLEAVSQQENIRRGNNGKHNRIKTHCPQGHTYSATNTYVYHRKLGNRRWTNRLCVTCAKARARSAREG